MEAIFVKTLFDIATPPAMKCRPVWQLCEATSSVQSAVQLTDLWPSNSHGSLPAGEISTCQEWFGIAAACGVWQVQETHISLPTRLALRHWYEHSTDNPLLIFERRNNIPTASNSLHFVVCAESYILPNPDEKYDTIPEIWQGHNIADYVDPDIMKVSG